MAKLDAANSVMGKKDYSTNYARFAAAAPLTITWTT